MLVDLQPGSDSGLYPDDNLTNVRTPIIDITAAVAGDAIRVYRQDALLGQATQVDGTLYRYTFTTGQLAEGVNSITARSFDGVSESGDSPALAITLDTTGPRSHGQQPQRAVDLRTSTLDHVAVTFSEPLDFAPGGGTFTVDDVAIAGPAGAITPTGITSLGNNEYQIAFAPQTARDLHDQCRPERRRLGQQSDGPGSRRHAGRAWAGRLHHACQRHQCRHDLHRVHKH